MTATFTRADPLTTGEVALDASVDWSVGSTQALKPTTALRRLGSSGAAVYPIALDALNFGTLCDLAASRAILDTFVGGGGNLIDGSDAYGAGESERVIGSWMRDRHNRDSLMLASKIGRTAEFAGGSPRSVVGAVEASLSRLRTDYLDVLVLDVDDQSSNFDETLLAVDELIRAGKVRFFGVSDHSADRLIEARVIAAQLRIAPMMVVQARYNLIDRGGYEPLLEQAVGQLGLAFMPRFSLAGGLLAAARRSRADRAASLLALRSRNVRIIEVVERIAREHGVPPAQIALAWLLARRGVVAPIVTVAGAAELDDVMGAPSLRLTRHDSVDLDRVSA